MAEPASQLLLLQKGDADIAGNLNADQLKGVVKNPACGISKIDQLNSLYLGLNGSLPQFQKIEVRQAIKWAIDYDAIADNITPNVWGVWQTFLPKGIARLDPRSSVQEGRREGQGAARRRPAIRTASTSCWTITPTRPSRRSPLAIQHDLARFGIKAQLLAGETKQVTTKMRARQHQMTLMIWFPDYLDPNSNAQAFNANPDDLRCRQAETAGLALPLLRQGADRGGR